jgi:hypothetical protein
MVVQEPEAATQEQENRALLAVMVGQAERAPEPGTMRARDILNVGDENIETPMVVKSLTSAGYRWIYDTVTGMRSLTNLNMLPAQLKKQRPDGTPVFTVQKPAVAPRQGTQKCLLHKDDPDRAHYEALGFSECPKANLPSPFMVERHMMRRHPAEWATIQQERTKKRDDERWVLEKAILQQAAGVAAARNPAPVEVPEKHSVYTPTIDLPRRGRPPNVPVRASAEGESNG